MVLHRIGIVGLGLIGGSLGLDLQKLGYEVYGVVRRKQTLKKAQSRGLAQLISTEFKILKDCSMVIMALPLSQLIHPPEELIHALPENAVITDVGSVKVPVINSWQKLHPRFVGSHPMAGTIETGVDAGKFGLFNNRPWIATPNQATDLKALEIVHQLAIDLGSNWITTDPKMHDQAVALISHLPVFISAALIQTVGNEKNAKLLKLAQAIASSGFEDTTRIGGGNPYLGVAMAENNTSAILDAMTSYRSSIEALEAIIRSKDWSGLQQELEATQSTRPNFINSKKLST